MRSSLRPSVILAIFGGKLMNSNGQSVSWNLLSKTRWPLDSSNPGLYPKYPVRSSLNFASPSDCRLVKSSMSAAKDLYWVNFLVVNLYGCWFFYSRNFWTQSETKIRSLSEEVVFTVQYLFKCNLTTNVPVIHCPMLLTMLPTRVEAVLFSEVTFIWTLHFKTITDLAVKNGTRKIRRKNVCPRVPVGMNCKPHDRRGSLRVRGVERGMSVGVYSAACSDHSHSLVAQWFQFGAHSSVVRLFSLNNQIFSVTTSTGRIRLTQFVWFVRQCWNSPHRTHVPFFLNSRCSFVRKLYKVKDLYDGVCVYIVFVTLLYKYF